MIKIYNVHYHIIDVYSGSCAFLAFCIWRVIQNLRETILPSTKNYKEMNQCNVKPDYIVYLYVLTVINKLKKKKKMLSCFIMRWRNLSCWSYCFVSSVLFIFPPSSKEVIFSTVTAPDCPETLLYLEVLKKYCKFLEQIEMQDGWPDLWLDDISVISSLELLNAKSL